MCKKIALLAIIITIFIAGNVLADEGPCGLYLTVMTSTNPEPYQGQWVKATINGVEQNNDTNSNGLVKFGWLGSTGIYYIETVIDEETYTTTVEKPESGVAVFYTWYIQLREHEEE
ncbi:MAG: hypothetical protein J7M10_00855 [Candidatus Cloacimonetes bacterium]|nr:hypothetical protein [Candidatus Cloacimonadota bacterium]